MKISQVFRYSRPYDKAPDTIDGLPNYFCRTASPGHKMALLESGINPIKAVSNGHVQRTPAILLRSSPHKIGSVDTPWQDFFDPDMGHIRYFGDNKIQDPPRDPSSARGNGNLLKQFSLQASEDISDRKLAAPIICFRAVSVNGKAKGNVQFEGFGIIKKVQRVSQFDGKAGESFTNYVFDIVVFDMTAENEVFFWDWVTARRDKTLSVDECLKLAPKSWQEWVRTGEASLERCRRRVSKLMTTSTAEQKASVGQELSTLEAIYRYYDNRKARFEALASIIAARVIRGDGSQYREGWITSASSDGGADFIGRLDIGSGLATAKVIVLGQAKCEKLDSPTGGNHIARTVARLRRGWIGVYVTTSYFSEAVQREIIEDKYPIILINGQRIAREVLSMIHERGGINIIDFLDAIDSGYDNMLSNRNAEEILMD